MGERPAKEGPDNGKTAEQLYTERLTRFQEAAQLKQPDRIPIHLRTGYLLAEIGAITKQELHERPEKAQGILEKAALEYQPDSITGIRGGPGPSRALGDHMTRWPGYGLGPNGSFQFLEHEFMKAEDYDEFLEDPADWGIRVYLPRAFTALEGLSILPPLGLSLFGYYTMHNIGYLTAPALVRSWQALAQAAQMAAESAESARHSEQRMASLGFPPSPFRGCSALAPFDAMSDTLRGMRGIMLDIFRRPDKLLAAEEKVAHFQLKHAKAFCRATGLTTVFFPLHRGSDGFMSLAQFEKFYWPQLKRMSLDLIDNGITPWVFYEGVWDQRLKYLAELPRGKTVGMFQSSDIFKVKEVVGDTMCIFGGMPNSLLQAGTVEQVRELTKRVCQVVGNGGGFIMSTGIGELEGCKPELVRAWVDATREYGAY